MGASAFHSFRACCLCSKCDNFGFYIRSCRCFSSSRIHTQFSHTFWNHIIVFKVLSQFLPALLKRIINCLFNQCKRRQIKNWGLWLLIGIYNVTVIKENRQRVNSLKDSIWFQGVINYYFDRKRVTISTTIQWVLSNCLC